MTYKITVTIDGLTDRECEQVTEDVREMLGSPYALGERAESVTVYGEPVFGTNDEVEVDGEPLGTLGELISSLSSPASPGPRLARHNGDRDPDELPGLGISPNKTPEENSEAFARALGLIR